MNESPMPKEMAVATLSQLRFFPYYMGEEKPLNVSMEIPENQHIRGSIVEALLGVGINANEHY